MNNTHTTTRLRALLALLAWTSIGNVAPALAEDACQDGCGEPPKAAAPDDGHGHEGHAHADPSAPIEARALAQCEHDVPIYQCDACRYEAGLVKVAPGLHKGMEGQGLVASQKVGRVKFRAALHVTGEVGLNENTAVHISPRIPGILETVSADLGARVKAGDVLFTLASVDLGRALADFERNQALAALSEKVLARETQLLEQKVGSEQDLIDARKEYEQHRAELKASEQALHVLRMTEEDLASLKNPRHGPLAGLLAVRAPRNGVILEKHAVAGELAEPGKDVMLLADLESLWVWAHVHSRDLARLLESEKAGPVPVSIQVNAFPDRHFEGILDYVGATMDADSRTIKVRATVRNPGLVLRPGMFCEAVISLDGGNGPDALAVPRAAVFSDEGKSFVFKHWKEDYFARQDVRLGRVEDGSTEILEGVQEGDVILSEGGFLLKSDLLKEKMGAGCAD